MARPKITEEIVELLAAGKTNAEIGRILGKACGQINLLVSKYNLENQALNKSLVIETVMENGVPVQKVRAAYAPGAEPSNNRRYRSA